MIDERAKLSDNHSCGVSELCIKSSSHLFWFSSNVVLRLNIFRLFQLVSIFVFNFWFLINMSLIKLNSFCLLIIGISLSPIQSNELTNGISHFATDLYEQCVKSKPSNMIISPLSVASSLALLSQATNGRTFTELQTGLHLPGDKAAVANQFHEYYGQLQRSIGDSTLSIANQICVQQGNQLNKDFHEIATTKFNSSVESLNFNEASKSAEIINHFVEEKTHGKIKDLVKPSSLSSDTLVYLVNAIYFKGDWEMKFDKSLTIEDQFFISETDSVPADFMRQRGVFNHIYLEEFAALELKYAKSKFSFVIILPYKRMGLSELEAKLKNYDLKNVTNQLKSRPVDVILPKFKVEYEIELNDVLKNLGMNSMFGNNADLGGLLETGDSLKVSKVIHKAFIEINEDGSEAAAGTGAGVERRLRPPKFQVNHPFMYFIRDTENDTIVFSGRMEKVDKSSSSP